MQAALSSLQFFKRHACMARVLMAVLVLAANLAYADPYQDLKKLDGLQLRINNIGADFGKLAHRYAAGDTRLVMAASHLASETLLASREIEQIKDAITGVALLQCDERARTYFRALARTRLGKQGVTAFLGLRAKQVGLWQSLVDDAEVAKYATTLQLALDEVRLTVEQLAVVYGQ